MDGSLKPTDGFSYYIVQDYQECTIEAETESSAMATDALMPIPN